MNKSLIIALAICAASVAQAQFIASTDNSRYALTVTRYGSLADAQAQTNAIGGPATVVDAATNDLRDLAVYFTEGVGGQDFSIFLTAWYYTTEANTNSLPKDDPSGDRYYSGWGNPNNNFNGFVQMYDDVSATRSSASGTWSVLNAGVADGSTFSLSASGANATYANAFSRLWPQNALGGDDGTFHTWNLNLTATGLTANWNGTLGMYESLDEATTVTGSFTGIFENQGTVSANNGFYVYSGVIQGGSWAGAQGNAALNGDLGNSQFAAVPEPATMTLLALAALKRRKRKNA